MATWQHCYRVEAEWPLATDAALFEEFDGILPNGLSWSAATLQWGDLDSHCIEADVDDSGLVQEISLRADARGDWRGFLTAVFSACRRCEVRLMALEGEVAFEDVDALIADMQASAAARFVRNPQKFIDELGGRNKCGEG